MFEPDSRYVDIEIATLTAADGREIKYIRRRFLPPQAPDAPVFVEHTVTEGERLDNITAQYLGDPEQFWQMADVNNAMHPDGLTAEIGRKLRVPVPQL